MASILRRDFLSDFDYNYKSPTWLTQISIKALIRYV